MRGQARDRVPGQGTTSANGGRGDRPASPVSRDDVPGWLRTAASWAWRVLLLALAVYILARVVAVLYVVVVPCAIALLLTALLKPLETRLRLHGLYPLPGRRHRGGMAPLASTWCTVFTAGVVIAGVAAAVTARVQQEYPSLLAQVRHTSREVQSWLAGPPFHLRTGGLDAASGGIVRYLSQHQSFVEGTVVTGGRIAVEILAGVVLTFFVTFFLLKDGGRIWHWLLRPLPSDRRERVDRAGCAAWLAVVYYVRGTVAVAAIHAVVMGTTLSIMNAPLAVPLALLMFLAAFVPLVGMLVAGALAILVTLAAKGWLAAVIVFGILIVMNQMEGHLLQPMVVGKMVRLHPLAVILVLAVGGVLAGIAGAVVAVPVTAALSRAVPELLKSGDGPPGPPGPPGRKGDAQ